MPAKSVPKFYYITHLCSAVARCQILGGHTVNRDVGYGVHSYINLKILGWHVPVCPPYEYGPVET